jgi:hypothetical protein
MAIRGGIDLQSCWGTLARQRYWKGYYQLGSTEGGSLPRSTVSSQITLQLDELVAVSVLEFSTQDLLRATSVRLGTGRGLISRYSTVGA